MLFRSDVPAINPNDHSEMLNPYVLPGFRADPPNYMTMGLKHVDHAKWLIIENMYMKFYEARRKLLSKKRSEVVQVTPEAEEACEELMREVVRFLTEMYSDFFEIIEKHGAKMIWNKLANEQMRIEKPWICHPLEMCARLAMEDFNVLEKSEFTGEHRL